MEPQYVPEFDVILAVVRWLNSKGWTIERLSLPHGAGIDYAGNKNRMKLELTKLGIEEGNVSLVSKGEDIRAKKGGTLWRIECKGLGESLKPSTVRNQFDRALASTVSYYNQTQGLQLGLAVPEECYKLIRDRLPGSLRSALNLWLFLYVSADEAVYAFASCEELPF